MGSSAVKEREPAYKDERFIFGKEFNKRIRELKQVIDKLNRIRDKKGRWCYTVHLYSKVLSQKGFMELPFPGYDIAYMTAHSSYVNEEYAICSLQYDNMSRKIRIANKRLKVYGCHLSGRVGGTVAQTDIISYLTDDLEQLENVSSCPRKIKIQVVSARL